MPAQTQKEDARAALRRIMQKQSRRQAAELFGDFNTVALFMEGR